MAAPKLSSQDRKDMEKFTKYLVYKCIQIIVQSRLGEKVRTRSKPFSSGSDWFNLAIKDIPEVLSETKKVFTSSSLLPGQYVCVEISLKTADGETMVLETWWLTVSEQTDPYARISYTVYNRMGILLKSLFSVSRMTPAYRLSRKQGPETFVICYRIYLGEPQFVHLGDGYEKSKVGSVPTPAGTISLSVAYRTKMLISPHQSVRDLCVDLKDDHFNSESSPRNISKPCFVPYRERRISFGEELQFAESQEFCATSFSTSPPDMGFYGNGTFPHNGTSPPYPRKQRKPSGDYSQAEDLQANGVSNGHGMPEKQPSFSLGQKMGAFAPYRQTEHQKEEEEEDDVPFMNLLIHSECHSRVDANANKQANGNEARNGELKDGKETTNGDVGEDNVDFQKQEPNDNTSTGSGSHKSGTSHGSAPGSAPEDFVMVELKTPFAGTDGNSDLGKFYRDCQGAPPLTMFESNSDLKEALNEITDQLVHFEENAKDFDEFVNSLAAEVEG